MKPSVTRTFETSASPQAVYDYMLDFTNAEQWDPGTESCERAEGDGGVGTTYRNVSSFLGNTVELTYTTEEAQSPTRVHLVGRNESFEGHDVFGISAAPGGGTRFRYHAEFSFSGASKLAAPLVAAYLPLLANKTVRQLKSCLDGLETA